MNGVLPTIPMMSYNVVSTRSSAEPSKCLLPHGCAGPTLLGQGFRVGMLIDLVGEGPATARREPMKVGTRTITIVHIRITDAGRQALMTERRSTRRSMAR